jgi:hypothetical protein
MRFQTQEILKLLKVKGLLKRIYLDPQQVIAREGTLVHNAVSGPGLENAHVAEA